MAEQMQYLEAVTHFIEAGENMKAVHAAIQGRQWSRALEILEQQRDENDPNIANYYKLLGRYFKFYSYRDINLLFSTSFCSNSRI
jgi:intraflagellar transport protein 172